MRPSQSVACLLCSALWIPFASAATASDPHDPADAPGWWERITVGGDFTARSEKRWFDDRNSDPHRLRYRLRVGAEVDLGRHVDFEFRIASGDAVNDRFTTLGGSDAAGDDADFSGDEFLIDRAFLTLDPLAHIEGAPLPGLRGVRIRIGKMQNPFDARVGQDLLVWDSDYTPEGIAASLLFVENEALDVDLDVAYYAIDEKFGARDPNLIALQLDTIVRPGRFIAGLDWLEWHFSSSLYLFRSIDSALRQRLTDGPEFFGNAAGLSGDNDAQFYDHRHAVVISAFEGWPIVLYGRFGHNVGAARRAPTFKEENNTWSVGLDVGDPARFGRFGGGYFYTQANSPISFLIDNELFDAHTNSKGFMVYWEKVVFERLTIGMQLLRGVAVNERLIPSRADQFDRWRLHTDVGIAF